MKFLLACLLGCIAVASAADMSTCEDLIDGTFIKDPENVFNYYGCYSGQAVIGTCPNNHIFEVERQYCRPLCNMNDTVTQTRYPNTCDRYFLCADNKLITLECPLGLQYNEFTGTCDLESVVGCVDYIEIKCPLVGFHHFAHPRDMRKFYICYEGESTEYQCQVGTLFDIITKSCIEIDRIA